MLNTRMAIKIRELSIDPPLALAPMVGLSHSALRSLIVELGGAGVFFTEMLSAKRLPEENAEISPLLIRSTAEAPLFYQVFLSQDDVIESAVAKLHTLNAQGIDINLGCPAPKLRKQGAGCALSNDRDVVKKIIRKFRASTELPVSVKIRLGKNGNVQSFLDLCTLIEDEGADLLTIHARFHGEKFCRKPKWCWISRAKEHVHIPIFANGGIFSVSDAKKCLQETRADGLMIGRGAAIKPWLFSTICQAVYGRKSSTDILYCKDVYTRFFELLELRFKKERRLGRLKQFTHYFAASYKYGHRLAVAVQTSREMEEARERAEAFFDTNEKLTLEGA